MELPLSVKFYTFTTTISLQEFRRKVKGKLGEFSGGLKFLQCGRKPIPGLALNRYVAYTEVKLGIRNEEFPQPRRQPPRGRENKEEFKFVLPTAKLHHS
jgi:hypothetical protein